MKVHTKETQATMTPQKALQLLRDGNKRFQANQRIKRDLLEQVTKTSSGQYPFATVLHCIDSRVSAELIFDQGVGDVFSTRVAGNIVNEDILGSMEFATKLAGTKLIVVLGHTSCGAVKGACDHVSLGNLTALINKIEPAVAAVEEPRNESLRNSSNIDFVNKVSAKNVEMTLERIRKESSVLAELEHNNEIDIVGAMYNISDGGVTFFE